ncbi:MAG: ABC transporter permease subunit [Clostridia bacterium]|nr:ABC transporter permease subunit [Clostridia bacterium]
MFAVYKKELRSYFSTPIGYIFVGLFLALSGAVFSMNTLQAREESSSVDFFSLMLIAFVVVLPLLTMKLFADERRLKTEQLLLTAPISLWSLVFAKFLAAYTIFSVTFLASCSNFFILFEYGDNIEGAIILGNIISILLIGAAFIAIGVFVSSLTENQLVAAIGTMAILLVLLLMDTISQYITIKFIRVTVKWFSIFTRNTDFSYGIFNFSALVYYASVAFIFLFLTVRLFEKRRWD